MNLSLLGLNPMRSDPPPNRPQPQFNQILQGLLQGRLLCRICEPKTPEFGRLLWLLVIFIGCSAELAQSQQAALRFVPLAPCRVADTRNANGPFGGPYIAGHTSRDFAITSSSCSVPASAAAYSLNLTVVPQTGFLAYVSIWPTGQPQPFVSTLNSTDGRIKANAAIVPAGSNGAVSVYVTDNTDVILDINGYFVVAAANPSALAFFPLTPCRVADTRDFSGPLGGPSLVGNQGRSLPILSSSCQIPATAQAYSLNLTSVPKGYLGFLTIWPTGMSNPWVSTLNATTGNITANAAIVPAGNGGAIDVFVQNDSDLVIDVNGYFASSSSFNDLSFFPVTPCRVTDTRVSSGSFSGILQVDTTASGCGLTLRIKRRRRGRDSSDRADGDGESEDDPRRAACERALARNGH